MNETRGEIDLSGLREKALGTSLTMDLDDGRGPLPISFIIEEAEAEIEAANALIEACTIGRDAGE